jgi:hypothetical protein
MTSRREFIKQLIGGTALSATPLLLSKYAAAELLHAELGPLFLPGGAWSQVPEILKRIKPPVFPKRDFAVTRFGAVGDGGTDCTVAFKEQLRRCAGGGRVVVPAGNTGQIHLKSNVNLLSLRSNHHVQPGPNEVPATGL